MDGAGAESFFDFICRAQSFLDQLAKHPAQDIAVFSHGQFINAVAWLIDRKPLVIDVRAWRTGVSMKLPTTCLTVAATCYRCIQTIQLGE
jgi:broad specificity phosphatase PhoE